MKTLPSKRNDQVKIISKTHFEKLGDMIKSLKNERNSFKDQVKKP